MANNKVAETKVDENPEVDAIFKKRESVLLTSDNSRFFRSGGGLISLELKKEDGSIEEFERVVVLRSFPISNPFEYISVREPSAKHRGNGDEIGMIRDIKSLSKDERDLIEEELSRRYFTPELTKIYSVKEKFGYVYFEAQSSAGKVKFVLSNPYSNFRRLENGSVLISDMDGNCFIIPNPLSLDKSSYKKIEIYL